MHWLDPNVLPSVKERVAHCTLNARGDVDGVLLDDDRQIHVPPHMGAALEKLVTLYAPKGEVCGAMLESGELLRVDPKADVELAPRFAKGAEIDAWGEGLKRRDVTVMDIHEIAFSSDLG